MKIFQGNCVLNYCHYLHIQKTLTIHEETTFLPNNLSNYFGYPPQNVDSQNLDLKLITSVEELDYVISNMIMGNLNHLIDK